MFLKLVRAVLAAAVVLLIALTGWLVRALEAPVAAPSGPETVFFEVERGWSARAVLERLREEGHIGGALPLRLACRFFYPGESFKAGEYRLEPSLRAKDALLRLFEGSVHLVPVTVPEGLTGREIAAHLWPDDPESAAAFRLACLDPGPIADLDPEAGDLEGYLFPDTYNLPRRAPPAELVAAMLAEFREAFDEDRRRRAAERGMSVRDVVTLASLIEEETALEEERPLVSAVFHNRLKIGMKLDCDPTVAYALKREGLYTGRLLLRDLKFPSPYNTYLHAGLPPGPIANPGRSSIEAALHPAAEDYLYFVARGDGGHAFSRTLGEHLAAVRKWRELQKR